jgi:hypothetical protein
MTGVDTPDQEPAPDEAQRSTVALKTRPAFAKLRRELTEDELGTPAVQRLLLMEIERLERVETELVGYRARFHDVDKRAAVLAEKGKKWTATEIVHAVCLSVGSALIGYAPSLSQPGAQRMAYALGIVLVAGAIFAKASQK